MLNFIHMYSFRIVIMNGKNSAPFADRASKRAPFIISPFFSTLLLFLSFRIQLRVLLLNNNDEKKCRAWRKKVNECALNLAPLTSATELVAGQDNMRRLSQN